MSISYDDIPYTTGISIKLADDRPSLTEYVFVVWLMFVLPPLLGENKSIHVLNSFAELVRLRTESSNKIKYLKVRFNDLAHS